MDRIYIKGLEVFANHGVYDAEQSLGQKFLVNACVFTDIRNAADEDALMRTVDYAALCRFITRYMKDHTWKLIETAAEHLAQAILTEFDTQGAIRRLDLQIDKPWAPVGLPLDSVSVRIVRGWTCAYLSIGSNLGDRSSYLEEAVQSLRRTDGIRVLAVSDWIETQPYGPVEQGTFLNGALRVETILSAHALLNALHTIEDAAGRRRTVRWGPRTLDLDILFYGDQILHEADLVIPHPDLENRMFVLEPLAQIDPYLRHPVTGQSILQMKQRLEKENPPGR